MPPPPPSEAPLPSDPDEILLQMCSTLHVCLMSSDSLTVAGKGGDSHDELPSRQAWCWGERCPGPGFVPMGSGGITEAQGPSHWRDVLHAPPSYTRLAQCLDNGHFWTRSSHSGPAPHLCCQDVLAAVPHCPHVSPKPGPVICCLTLLGCLADVSTPRLREPGLARALRCRMRT